MRTVASDPSQLKLTEGERRTKGGGAGGTGLWSWVLIPDQKQELAGRRAGDGWTRFVPLAGNEVRGDGERG